MFITTRSNAEKLIVTNPYPEMMNGKRKQGRDQIWIPGTYGQPSKESAILQLLKVMADYKKQEGFHCEEGHYGVFEEKDSSSFNYYNERKTWWKFFIHYCTYK